MAAAERRRGRRDNGLDATDWRALQDLDPRLAEEVLDLLATRGIAAYVQPAMDVDPITRSATVPNRPKDRLYVDRRQADVAREHLHGLLGRTDRHEETGRAPGDPADRPDPGTGPTTAGPDGSGSGGTGSGGGGAAGSRDSAASTDLDTAFAGIVAGFDRPVDPATAAWPAVENVSGPDPVTPGGQTSDPPPAHRPAQETDRGAGPVDARDVTEPSLLDALDTFGTRLPDQEPPERFVPPTPPPLPRLSRQTVLGWVAIAVGLVLLIAQPAALPFERDTTMLLGFSAVLGGAIALILRLRPGTDPDEDIRPDDGAQV